MDECTCTALRRVASSHKSSEKRYGQGVGGVAQACCIVSARPTTMHMHHSAQSSPRLKAKSPHIQRPPSPRMHAPPARPPFLHEPRPGTPPRKPRQTTACETKPNRTAYIAAIIMECSSAVPHHVVGLRVIAMFQSLV